MSNTLFTPYTTPDIPAVNTSVLDQSIREEAPDSRRAVFLAFPSKFGLQKVTKFSRAEDLASSIGDENTFKYGLGQFYAKSFIKAGATVYHKRLEDPQATYANSIIFIKDDAFGASTVTKLRDKDLLTTPDEDADPASEVEVRKASTLFSLLARGKGAGYNDLFTAYRSAHEYESFEADNNGVKKYRFNFIQAGVYETGSEVKSKSNGILFSLMDIDPYTKQPINHTTNGNFLHVNTVFKNSNDYVSAQVNPKFQDQIREYPNIQAVRQEKASPTLIVEAEATAVNPALSVSQREYYEVSIDDTNRTSPEFKIVKVLIEGDLDPVSNPATFGHDGSVYMLTVTNTNGRLALKRNQITPTDPADTITPTWGESDVAYLDGINAFYTFKTTDTEFKIEIFEFLRWKLYDYLMTYNIQLLDGEDSIAGGFQLANGGINIEEVSRVMDDYFINDKEIREVLYPKHIFNYMIDWTQKPKSTDTLTVLADRIQRSMHIAGCPSVRKNGLSPDYSLTNDIMVREQFLTRSSYNTMLYSSQMNKTHIDTDTRLTHALPASYYAMLSHLAVDNDPSYGITEPVANIVKGQILTDNLNLTNELDSEDIAIARKQQINCIVTDALENYFIDQITMYKRTSKLSLANVAKTIQQLQIDIPARIKPFLQKKETDTAITADVLQEIQNILKPYKVSTSSKDAIFDTIQVKTSYNNNVLTITIRLEPVGTTEKINVPIIVHG